uniref:Uncharacterized protein n=1 Tax=Opuntia streptacantha TaxID=393608 RepID=A0A7C9AD41_OPUST
MTESHSVFYLSPSLLVEPILHLLHKVVPVTFRFCIYDKFLQNGPFIKSTDISKIFKMLLCDQSNQPELMRSESIQLKSWTHIKKYSFKLFRISSLSRELKISISVSE